MIQKWTFWGQEEWAGFGGQDCFTSEDRVQRLLKNVSSLLMPGGYFFGATPDSSTIWYTHYLTFWSIICVIFKTLSYASTDTRYKYQKAVEEAMKAGSLRVNGTLPRVRTELYNISFEDDRYVLSTCGYL
jgi:mRNA (guanine-N7-)-methyltransferase